MKVTVFDKSYTQDVAVEIDGECNHGGDIIFKEVVRTSRGGRFISPETYEVEVCERCGESV